MIILILWYPFLFYLMLFLLFFPTSCLSISSLFILISLCHGLFPSFLFYNLSFSLPLLVILVWSLKKKKKQIEKNQMVLGFWILPPSPMSHSKLTHIFVLVVNNLVTDFYKQPLSINGLYVPYDLKTSWHFSPLIKMDLQFRRLQMLQGKLFFGWLKVIPCRTKFTQKINLKWYHLSSTKHCTQPVCGRSGSEMS